MTRIADVKSNRTSVTRRGWWVLALGSFGVALLALAVSSPGSRGVSAGNSCPFTIDFAGLPAGTILGEQYADFGVHISGVGRLNTPDALIVFDTNAPPTHDPDLAVDIGNIAIFAKNLTDEDPADGLVDDPDENDVGGIATFAFDQEVSIGSVKWIDKDHAGDNFVIAYNAAGEVIISVSVPLGANASVQTIPINADGVRRLVFDYAESGGFTGIEVDCATQATATPTSVAETPTPTEPVPTPSPTQAGATSTPAATDTPAPTATPSDDTSTQATPVDSPAPPTATVAAAVAPPAADTSVSAGPGALPAGGGPPTDAKDAAQWAGALIVLGLVLAGSMRSMRRG
jgi:hypothetical protein